MTLAIAHGRATFKQLVREPMFAVPTVIFPSMFFVFFGSPNASTPTVAAVLTSSFMMFALFGVCFFQFGVGIASTRTTSWEQLLRVLPVGSGPRFGGQVLTGLVFGATSIGLLVAVSSLTTPLDLDATAWLRLVPAMAVGGLMVGFAGLALGYWASPHGAVPVANVLYLTLSYLGGLWMPPSAQPDVVETVGRYLPTRVWADVTWPSALGVAWSARPWLLLAGYVVAFALLAAAGYRRDHQLRYS